MKKKIVKKLVLAKETVKCLDLRNVAGQYEPEPPYTMAAGCTVDTKYQNIQQ